MISDEFELSLADRFLGDPRLMTWQTVEEKAVARLRNRVRSAHRFVLDEPGNELASAIIDDTESLILQHQPFARPPFDLTWIEGPGVVLGGGEIPNDLLPSPNRTWGWLIDHGTVYMFGGRTKPDTVVVQPWTVSLHTPWPFEDQLRLLGLPAGADEHAVIRELYPDSAELRRVAPDWWAAHHFRHSHRVDLLPRQPGKAGTEKRLLRSCELMIRKVVGLLLLLNRPGAIRFIRDRSAGRRFYKGKLRPYLSHTLVTVTLDARTILRKLDSAAGESIERRRHEVKGHFCHDKVYWAGSASGCIHHWAVLPWEDDDPLEPDHFVCKDCGGRRWWRHSHVRGNAGVGWVTKEYAVTSES